MLVTFPLLLLLFSGSNALVPFVDRFIQGDDSGDFDASESHELTPSAEWFIQVDFDDTDPSEDRSDELAWKDTNEYTVETVRGILYGTVGSKMRHDTRRHVQHTKDDFQAMVPLIDRFIQGDDSGDVDASEDRSNHLARKDADEYIAETLRASVYGNAGWKTPDDSRKHFVQHPKDDDDLDLVMNFLRNGSYDKTGQLKYDSVPVVESELVKDILNVIYSHEEYVHLLNNPERSVMTEIVKEMIRIPTQTVLQQQLFHKIVEERAWRKKFIDPMIENNKRNKLINFGRHLLEAKRNGTLSTEDTTDFNHNLENFAFFDREEDKEFEGLVDRLIEAFGTSVYQKQNNESIDLSVAPPPSTDQAANKVNEHRHGFFNIIPESEDRTPIYPTSPPTTNVPKRNSNRVSYLVPKFRRSEFRATGRYETTTVAPFDDTTTAEYDPSEEYSTTRGYVHSTEAPYTTTGPSDEDETTTAEYVPSEEYRTTRGYVHSTKAPYTTTGPSDGETTTAEYVPSGEYRTTRGYVHSTEAPYTTSGPSDGETTTAEYVPSEEYRTTRGYVHTTKVSHTTTARYGTTTDSYGTTDNQEYTTTSGYKPTSSFAKQRNWLDASMLYSNKSDQTESKNSSGKVSSIAKDDVTEIPIVYVRGLNDDDGVDSFDSRTKKDSIKKPENKNSINSNKNLANKTSAGKSFDNLSRKVSSIVKDDVTENPIVYVRGLNENDGDGKLGSKKDSIKIHMTPSGTETARLSSLYKNAPVNKKAATVENNNANKTSTVNPTEHKRRYVYEPNWLNQ